MIVGLNPEDHALHVRHVHGLAGAVGQHVAGSFQLGRLHAQPGGPLELFVHVVGHAVSLGFLGLVPGGQGIRFGLDLLGLGQQALVGAGTVVQLLGKVARQRFEGIVESLLWHIPGIVGIQELLDHIRNFIKFHGIAPS